MFLFFPQPQKYSRRKWILLMSEKEKERKRLIAPVKISQPAISTFCHPKKLLFLRGAIYSTPFLWGFSLKKSNFDGLFKIKADVRVTFANIFALILRIPLLFLSVTCLEV